MATGVIEHNREPHASTEEVGLLTDVATPFYNSLRVHGKLDSSPMELKFTIAQPFREAIDKQIDAFQRSRQVTTSEAVDAILRGFVHIEPVYYDGTQPFIFCPETIPHEKNVEAPRLMFEWFYDGNRNVRSLSVFVQRNMPLSTNHRGARFRLGIIVDFSKIGGSVNVLYTSSFEVLAKQGPSNKRKQLYWPEYEPVEHHRAFRLKQIERFLADHKDELYKNPGVHSFNTSAERLNEQGEQRGESQHRPDDFLGKQYWHITQGGQNKRQKALHNSVAVQTDECGINRNHFETFGFRGQGSSSSEDFIPGGPQQESSHEDSVLSEAMSSYNAWTSPKDFPEGNDGRSFGLNLAAPQFTDITSGSDTQTQTPQSSNEGKGMEPTFTLSDKPGRVGASSRMFSPSFGNGLSHEPTEADSAATPSHSESSMEEMDFNRR
eukprot:gb/GECG01000145.1/.p1 GENE.gb/GECG01000145.1/~~gb/GECG01000145.1/.p1  ORF type:complete len:435 (+),score=56.72 gb/GECG01000145.1/:1-1305(+)